MSANQPEPSFENDFGKWIESNGVVLNPYLNDDGSFRADKIDLNQLKVGFVDLKEGHEEAAVREAKKQGIVAGIHLVDKALLDNVTGFYPVQVVHNLIKLLLWENTPEDKSKQLTHPQAGEGEGK